MMDYIKQILAFDDYLMYNQGLSSGQIALWRALMSINNKTRWSEWFTASNQTLETLAGLSRQGINKNRNVLKQLGLIDFQTNGRKATSYHICKLYTSDSVQGSLQEDVRKLSTSNSLQESVQDSLQSSSETVAEKCTTQLRNSSTLYKHKQNININETNINNNNKGSAIRSIWENNGFGLMSPKTMTDFDYWISDFEKIGATQENAVELIIKAIEIAIDANARNYNYINAILKDWEQKGFKSVKEQEAAKNQKKTLKQQKPDTGDSEYDDLGF